MSAMGQQRRYSNCRRTLYTLISMGDAYISAELLPICSVHIASQAFSTCHLVHMQEDALKMIQLLDQNKDRRISYNEFMRFAALLPETQLKNGNVAFCWVDSAGGRQCCASRLPARFHPERSMASRP